MLLFEKHSSLSQLVVVKNQTHFDHMHSFESEKVKRFAQTRRAQYMSSRFALKHLFKKYGLDLTSLESDQDGVPLYPQHISACLSHTYNYSVAISSSLDIHLGVDIEKIISPARIEVMRNKILHKNDLALSDQQLREMTLIFSAKESLFKALFPTVRCFFGFEEASCLSIDHQHLTLELHSQKEQLVPFNRKYQLQWFLFDEHVITTFEHLK